MVIGDKILSFDFPIKEHLLIDGVLVILLETPSRVVLNENVYGIDVDSKQVKWQIQKQEYTDTECPYIALNLIEGELTLVNWCSFYAIVQPANGEILASGFTK